MEDQQKSSSSAPSPSMFRFNKPGAKEIVCQRSSLPGFVSAYGSEKVSLSFCSNPTQVLHPVSCVVCTIECGGHDILSTWIDRSLSPVLNLRYALDVVYGHCTSSRRGGFATKERHRVVFVSGRQWERVELLFKVFGLKDAPECLLVRSKGTS